MFKLFILRNDRLFSVTHLVTNDEYSSNEFNSYEEAKQAFLNADRVHYNYSSAPSIMAHQKEWDYKANTNIGECTIMEVL